MDKKKEKKLFLALFIFGKDVTLTDQVWRSNQWLLDYRDQWSLTTVIGSHIVYE